MQCFMKLHPMLSMRTPERVSKARVGVTETSIREWFGELRRNIAEFHWEEIFSDPSRIYNSDESNIQLCPKTGKVIGLKGWKNVYELGPGPEKSTLTFLGTFNASGDIVQPMIVYPYVRVPSDIVRSVPQEFMIGATESGWMRSETFFEYISNGFVPYLNDHNIERPVILFIDGHKTHLSMQVSKFCEENQVVLYVLPPNTTHLLQPADVSVFKPLKEYWRQEVHNFQRIKSNCLVRRKDVAPMLLRVLRRIKRSSIVNGFRVTELFPLNEDNVDYTKCLELDDPNEGIVNPPIPQENSTTTNDYLVAERVPKEELEEIFVRCKNGAFYDRNLIGKAFQTIVRKSEEISGPEPIIMLDNATEFFDANIPVTNVSLNIDEPDTLSDGDIIENNSILHVPIVDNMNAISDPSESERKTMSFSIVPYALSIDSSYSKTYYKPSQESATNYNNKGILLPVTVPTTPINIPNQPSEYSKCTLTPPPISSPSLPIFSELSPGTSKFETMDSSSPIIKSISVHKFRSASVIANTIRTIKRENSFSCGPIPLG